MLKSVAVYNVSNSLMTAMNQCEESVNRRLANGWSFAPGTGFSVTQLTDPEYEPAVKYLVTATLVCKISSARDGVW